MGPFLTLHVNMLHIYIHMCIYHCELLYVILLFGSVCPYQFKKT